MSTTIAAGDKAPDLALKDQHGKLVKLSTTWKRGPVVLYFYPKDETPGCTKEACAFRDAYEVFTDAGAAVIGVSRDSVASHRDFATHHRLPFTLLADEDGAARERYGVPKTLGLLDGRVTFVIDRKGVVRKVFSSQFLAAKHVEQALAVIRTLTQE
ncbi:MAG: peroxiredoxin [Acidobacteriota bacterium]